MKKIIYGSLLIVITLLMNACYVSNVSRYYTVSNGTSAQLTGTICEYDSHNRCVVTQNFALDAGMTTPSIKALSRTSAVRLYLSDFDLWVGETYYLNSGSYNHIMLYDNTPLVVY